MEPNFFFQKPLKKYGLYLMTAKSFEEYHDGIEERMVVGGTGIITMQKTNSPTLANNFRQFLTTVKHRPVKLPEMGEFVKFEL